MPKTTKKVLLKVVFHKSNEKPEKQTNSLHFSHRRNVFCSVFILNKSPQVSLSVTVKLHYKIQFYTAFLIFFYKIRIEREKNLITRSSTGVWKGTAGEAIGKRPQKPQNATNTQPKPPSLFKRRHFDDLDQCRSSWHAKTKLFLFSITIFFMKLVERQMAQ